METAAPGTVRTPETSQASDLREEDGRPSKTRQVVPSEVRALGDRISRLDNPECKEKIWPKWDFVDSKPRAVDSGGNEFVFDANQKSFVFQGTREVARNFLYSVNSDQSVTILTPRVPKPSEDRTKGSTPQRDPSKGRKEFYCENELGRTNNLIMQSQNANKKGPPSQDDLTSSTLNILSHESFHSTFQTWSQESESGKKKDKQTDWIADSYTNATSSSPEFALGRQHILRYLKAAIDSWEDLEKRRKALSQVAAWYRKIEKDYPQEAKNMLASDRLEGAAEYAGTMTDLMSRGSCSRSSADLVKEFKEYSTGRVLGGIDPVSGQSYYLGSSSGFILDLLGNTDWKTRVSHGQAPLPILISELGQRKMIDVPAPIPLTDLEESAQASQEYRKCLDSTFQKMFDDAQRDPSKYTLVQLDSSSGIQSFQGAASVIISNQKQKVMIGTGHNKPISGAATITLDENAPCGAGFYVLLPKSAVTKLGDEVQIKVSPGQYHKVEADYKFRAQERTNSPLGLSTLCSRLGEP